MLIDLLTYFRLDKTALISALGFIKKTVINPGSVIICKAFGYCMACRGSGVRIFLAPLIIFMQLIVNRQSILVNLMVRLII